MNYPPDPEVSGMVMPMIFVVLAIVLAIWEMTSGT